MGRAGDRARARGGGAAAAGGWRMGKKCDNYRAESICTFVRSI